MNSPQQASDASARRIQVTTANKSKVALGEAFLGELQARLEHHLQITQGFRDVSVYLVARAIDIPGKGLADAGRTVCKVLLGLTATVNGTRTQRDFRIVRKLDESTTVPVVAHPAGLIVAALLAGVMQLFDNQEARQERIESRFDNLIELLLLDVSLHLERIAGCPESRAAKFIRLATRFAWGFALLSVPVTALVGYIVLNVQWTRNWFYLGMTVFFTSLLAFSLIHPGGILLLPKRVLEQETAGRRVTAFFSAGSVASLKLRCFAIVAVTIALAVGMWVWSFSRLDVIFR